MDIYHGHAFFGALAVGVHESWPIFTTSSRIMVDSHWVAIFHQGSVATVMAVADTGISLQICWLPFLHTSSVGKLSSIYLSKLIHVKILNFNYHIVDNFDLKSIRLSYF